MGQIIIHVDMDAFYAAVEMRDNPALRGKPLVIGSLPNERGVVSTCNYAARKYGVHSGMNIKDAYRLCPNGVYMHPNFDKYKSVSRQLHEIWDGYATASESVAFDEAYLDVTETAGDFAGARKIAHEIKRRVRDELRLSCSVGVAYSKTAAKIASEENKPDGYFEIETPDDFVNLITDRDVGVLYTVGKRTAQKLSDAGIKTVRDIRDNGARVIELLGKHGRWLTNIAAGIDNRRVTPYDPHNAKTIGREITFQQDVNNFDLLRDVLLLLSLCVEHRVNRVGLVGGGVTLKITYSNMRKITRSELCSCDGALSIYHTATRLLGNIDWRPVRLIGVGVYNLTHGGVAQLSLSEMLKTNASESELHDLLSMLGNKYNLDFEGNLTKIFEMETLYKTIEYMRRHAVPV